MNTPAHLLMGAALFGGRRPRLISAALAGALLPDVSLYLLAGVSLFLLNIPPQVVFDELYFSDAWQTVFAIDNSILLWGAGLALALWYRSEAWSIFAAAGLLHLGLDFVLHHDDGRPHFWPVSDWVFVSPVSYWDSAHYARLVAPVAAAVSLICALRLWRVVPGLGWRLLWFALLAAELWTLRQWLMFF